MSETGATVIRRNLCCFRFFIQLFAQHCQCHVIMSFWSPEDTSLSDCFVKFNKIRQKRRLSFKEACKEILDGNINDDNDEMESDESNEEVSMKSVFKENLKCCIWELGAESDKCVVLSFKWPFFIIRSEYTTVTGMEQK